MKTVGESLRHHLHALKSGIPRSTFESNQLIIQSSKHGLLRQARHLFDQMPERNVFSWNAIISAYVKARNLEEAETLFSNSEWKDTVTYNSMLSGYVSADGYERKAMDLFIHMRSEDGVVRADEFTLTTMLNLSAKLSQASYGKQLHSLMAKSGNDVSGFAVSSLIDMYSKCRCFSDARTVFDGCGSEIDLVAVNAMVAACCRVGEMDLALGLLWRETELNDAVTWNTVISGFVQTGCETDALKLSVRMMECGFRWNEHTFASVLSACSGLKCLKLGKAVHARVLIENVSSNPYVTSGIVDVYCKCGHMKNAELAYAHVAKGMGNVFAITSMIVGYSTQGSMAEARRLFDSLVDKSSVAWTALFSGYLKSEQYEGLFELVREFIATEASACDALMLINFLRACAIQATIDPGKQIHAYTLRFSMKAGKKLISAMVDMYSKCGNITYAENLFREASNEDTVLYNIMIAGYAHHGHEGEAFRLFEQMLERGMRPDPATFVAVLSACRHAGLVETGERYFASMTKDYSVEPEIDHYVCMTDLYGRANQLDKAVTFLKNVPVELDAAIWGVFMHACKLNRNVELALRAEQKLLEIDPGNGARYVQLANVYASEGRWSEMGRVRKNMRVKEAKKHAGCSWVHLENNVHVFTSGDTSHLRSEDISAILACLTKEVHYRRHIIKTA
uniref:Pentatricopeptide repeat-containing protein n=1 Tax=Kalanchoe fedtschenkoi TaxID=63787 RepID=A0A7N0T1Z1_KALFE